MTHDLPEDEEEARNILAKQDEKKTAAQRV